MTQPVTVSIKDNVVHFHVFGDNKVYLDRTSVLLAHPEVTEYMKHNGLALERELLQQKENFDL